MARVCVCVCVSVWGDGQHVNTKQNRKEDRSSQDGALQKGEGEGQVHQEQCAWPGGAYPEQVQLSVAAHSPDTAHLALQRCWLQALSPISPDVSWYLEYQLSLPLPKELLDYITSDVIMQ